MNRRFFLGSLLSLGAGAATARTAAPPSRTIRFGVTAVFLYDRLRMLARWQSYLEGATGTRVQFVQYPVADFEQRSADISVLYPDFVSNYRNAHAIAVMSQNNGTSTEDLRQAMVYYRSLFEELLETEKTTEMEVIVS